MDFFTSYGDGELNGWLYGELSAPWSGDNLAFIYPDYKTVLIGRFANSVMIAARETRIKGYR